MDKDEAKRWWQEILWTLMPTADVAEVMAAASKMPVEGGPWMKYLVRAMPAIWMWSGMLDETGTLKNLEEMCRYEGWYGYVYLLHIGNNIYKIGQTIRPYGRMKDLCNHWDFENMFPEFKDKIDYSFDLVHLIECKDYETREKEMHAKFRPKRIRGEYFRLTEEDVSWFCSIVALESTRLKEYVAAKKKTAKLILPEAPI